MSIKLKLYNNHNGNDRIIYSNWSSPFQSRAFYHTLAKTKPRTLPSNGGQSMHTYVEAERRQQLRLGTGDNFKLNEPINSKSAMAHLLPLVVVGNAARGPDYSCCRKHNPQSDFSPWPVSLGIFIFIQLTATWIESTHSRPPRLRSTTASSFRIRTYDGRGINLPLWVIYWRVRQSNGGIKRIYFAEHFENWCVRRSSVNWILFERLFFLWFPLLFSVRHTLMSSCSPIKFILAFCEMKLSAYDVSDRSQSLLIFMAIGYVLCCAVEWTSVSPSTHTQRPIYSVLFYGNRKFVFFIKYDELSMNKVRQLIQVCALSVVVLPFGPVRPRCGDTVGGGGKWSIQCSVLESVESFH